MKKILMICLLSVAVAAFSGAQDLEGYWRHYNMATTNTDQLEILQMLSRQNPTGMGDFYIRALRRLVAGYTNVRGATQLYAADGQAFLLSSAIGNEGPSAAAAASDLWLVAERFKDPTVRAEALTALGKIQASEYLPQIIKVLNDSNQSVTIDRLSIEKVVSGAIIALEKLADPSGYLPVYFASVGWYSDRIRSQAAKALPSIAEDPSPFLIGLLRSRSYNYQTKLTALQYAEDTDIPSEKKAEMGVIALDDALKAYTSDIGQRSILRQIRKLSMKMIGKYGTDDTSVYPLLERCFKEGVDTTEKEDAISAITQLATDNSARMLSNFLLDMNDKLKNKRTTAEDEYLVRIIIPSLGSIKSRESLFALTATTGSDWVPVVKKLAEDALRQIQ